jgi:YegS/Rv2252/BmrU family lipid kinase
MRAFTALVNPISGGGRAAERWAPLAGRLSTAGADVRVELTRGREHAVEAARTAADEGRVVVAVGGDGLVRDVAEGVVTTAGTMAIVPAGRGNDLARTLRLPTSTDGLADLLLTAEPRPLDVIDLDGTIVVGNVYCGIDSVSNAIINANRRIPAKLVYRLAPVRAILTWHAPTFTVTLDGDVRTLKAHSVVVANSGAYGHGLRIVPSAVLDDGRLDVLLVGDGPRRAVVSFMRAAQRGTHVSRAEVEVVRAREVTIAADRSLPVCGDGEELGTLPATMRIRAAALPLLAPPA